MPDETEVRIGRTNAPVLLALMNNRLTPTTWRISRTSDAQILGVMVLDIHQSGRGSQDALSFDPLRPAFLGEALHCRLLVLAKSDARQRNELRPYWRPNPAGHSYNPFQLRGEPPIQESAGSQFTIGVIPPAAVMTSWPEERRVKASVPKQ